MHVKWMVSFFADKVWRENALMEVIQYSYTKKWYDSKIFTHI